jgi:lipopolysaccharide/colanic/teichoic acid biosynthesis glycosyltransferase
LRGAPRADEGKMNNILKRIFDIAAATMGLIALSPLLLYLVVRIKRGSPGPIFYRGVRVGRKGKTFRIFKFRTMVVDAEKIGGPSTSDDDPRVTGAGKVMRDYKLDELPQLLNVLKGEMSIIGPRPEVPSEVETYSEREKRIFEVRPGITDWASLEFHNEGEILKGAADPHAAYREKIKPEKIKLALKYVDEQNMMTDMKILFKTLGTLIKTRTNGESA